MNLIKLTKDQQDAIAGLRELKIWAATKGLPFSKSNIQALTAMRNEEMRTTNSRGFISSLI